jgi:2-phosphosulfolactate phosphatase
MNAKLLYMEPGNNTRLHGQILWVPSQDQKDPIVPIQNFRYFNLEQAHLAHGAVVVIDVLRAFTTAAYAFHAGAKRIYPVGSIEQAIELQRRFPGSLMMGEVDGKKPISFDLSNSPAEIAQMDLENKILIQRTTAGTQGIIKAAKARVLMAASFVVAKPTANALRRIDPDLISFVITGQSLGRDGDEDRACADYIAALICGGDPDPDKFTPRVLSSSVGKAFQSLESDCLSDYLSNEDIQLSLAVNRFDFFLAVKKQKGRLVIVRGNV